MLEAANLSSTGITVQAQAVLPHKVALCMAPTTTHDSSLALAFAVADLLHGSQTKRS